MNKTIEKNTFLLQLNILATKKFQKDLKDGKLNLPIKKEIILDSTPVKEIKKFKSMSKQPLKKKNTQISIVKCLDMEEEPEIRNSKSKSKFSTKEKKLEKILKNDINKKEYKYKLKLSPNYKTPRKTIYNNEELNKKIELNFDYSNKKTKNTKKRLNTFIEPKKIPISKSNTIEPISYKSKIKNFSKKESKYNDKGINLNEIIYNKLIDSIDGKKSVKSKKNRTNTIQSKKTKNNTIKSKKNNTIKTKKTKNNSNIESQSDYNDSYDDFSDCEEEEEDYSNNVVSNQNSDYNTIEEDNNEDNISFEKQRKKTFSKHYLELKKIDELKKFLEENIKDENLVSDYEGADLCYPTYKNKKNNSKKLDFRIYEKNECNNYFSKHMNKYYVDSNILPLDERRILKNL